MLEYEIEIGKEEQDALLEITLQSDGYRKRRKVVTITSVIMCIICLPSGMLSFMLGRAGNGFTFYDSLGSFSIFCMRREKGTAESKT